jgi:hypothetical protein
MAKQPIWAQYIRCWYAIGNIVSSVGSGDVFATTDLERIFFIHLFKRRKILTRTFAPTLSKLNAS